MTAYRRVDAAEAWPPKPRAGRFPRDPATCSHPRWSPVMDLRTGQMTGEVGCWFCGVRKP